MCAFFALLILSPVILILWIGLGVANRGAGAFFTQDRPGLHGKIFKIYKFKTMNDACDSDGNLLPDGERLTPIGKFIRKLSLDELPQLWNVLKGDMSLIGPRPLLPQYLALYSSEQARRHNVRPGITGWAQVNGRNNITWKRKFELDVYYVQHIGPIMDCKVFLTTIKKVLFREDINQDGTSFGTIDPFNGNN